MARNTIRHFDALVQTSLGHYVYGLLDSRQSPSRVFYVGKGGGSEDSGGNARLFEHFAQADKESSNPTANRSRKVQTILDIWTAGLDVTWCIFRHSLSTPEVAFHVEAAILDALEVTKNGRPENDIEGMWVREHGFLRESNAFALGAQPVNPASPYDVLIFNINSSLGRKRRKLITSEDVYECTRGAWILGKEFRLGPTALAVGVMNDIGWGTYTNLRWQDPEVLQKRRTKTNKIWTQSRYSFQAEPVPPGHDLALKHWGNVRQPIRKAWSRLQVVVVSFDGFGHFEFLRGAGKDAKGRRFYCSTGEAVP